MKRALGTIAIACAAAMTFAGCTSGQEGSSGSPGSESGSGQSPANLDSASPSELYKIAKKEGKVVVYSYTSRIAEVEKAFEKKYPGVDLVGQDISTTKQISRLTAEAKAGSLNADVAYLSSGGAQVLSQLVEPGILKKYVPPALKAKLPTQYKEPLVANRVSTKVLLYNQQAYPNGSPITNLWQLTKPEWKGRVLMVDPAVRGEYLSLMTEFVVHSKAMAKAYKKEFGEPISLDDGVKDAGHQFIKDLYANGLILVDDTDTINAAVGEKGQKKPPVGFSSYSDTRANKTKGWALQVAAGVAPSSGITYEGMLGIVKGADHPAAARLLIGFLFGDESSDGGPGYAPFYDKGDYPTRPSISTPPGAVTLDELGAWNVDVTKIGPIDDEVADFLLTIS